MSYSEMIEKKPVMTKEDFFVIAGNLIRGLMLIHSKGIAHRDIHVRNIMIDPKTLGIKYIDFGFSTSKKEDNFLDER